MGGDLQIKRLAAASFVSMLGLMAAAAPNLVQATMDTADPAYDMVDDTAEIPLFLEVFINGKPTNLIAEFAQDGASGALSTVKSELIELGLKPPAGIGGTVALDDLPGVTHEYDSAGQTLDITATDAALMPKVISANRRKSESETERTVGAVLNYDLSATFGDAGSGSDFMYRSSQLGLDAWVFSPVGRLGNTANVTHTANGDARILRLGTTYEFNAPKPALTISAGDVFSSSLRWGRSIRMGGVQLRRDFGLRRDLVTEPLLSFGGAAAVPSTVDVFIDNNRVFSGRTTTGPFQFEDIPIVDGAGEAVVVIQDEFGEVSERRVEFFASRNLLKKGVWDFSVEAGWAREAYGQQSGRYNNDALFSGSVRYGATNRLTFSGHVEGKSDLVMLGLGTDFVLANRAEMSLAVARSSYRGNQGSLAFGAVRTSFGRVDLEASSLRSTNGFADLAYATAVDFLPPATLAGDASLLEFPKAQDVISLSAPLGDDQTRIGLNYVRSDRASGSDRLVSINYSGILSWREASISVSAAYDFEASDPRLSAFLTIPLGSDRFVQANASVNRNTAPSRSVSFAQAMGDQPGDHGYAGQIDFNAGAPDWQTSAFLRTRYGRAEASLRRTDSGTSTRGRFEGGLVFAGGQLVAGPQVRDSFAIVDAGQPDMPVLFQNREIARTGRGGRALVTGLSSYQRNRISIRSSDGDASVSYGVTAQDVVPARGSGALVSFEATDTGNAALVEFVDAGGRPLPVGATVHHAGGEFVIGYDGVAYLTALRDRNTVKVDLPGGRCRATFDFVPGAGLQSSVEGVVCR